MNKEIQAQIDKVKEIFPKSFIYEDDELIVEPKHNIYFRVDNIETELDFKCKMIEYLSRPAHKGLPKKWQGHLREGLNRFLKTNFTVDELSEIYTFLGCTCSRKRTEKFIASGCDVKSLEEYHSI